MIKNTIKYIAISDIHLGHHRTKTEEIVTGLRKFFESYKTRNDIDIIFIAGDLFDRLLTAPSDDFTHSILFMHWLLDFCKTKKIKLRVLEGTPSHDWKQSKHFDTFIEANKSELDFKYFETLAIEYIEDLDISVLYIPDEWDPSTEKTYRDVEKAMAQKGIHQVDLAMMHGQFGYQLPAHIKTIPRHDESKYLSIVKYFINIGHIHTFSVYERIIAQGSFDRLSHGEEEPKGGVECHIHKDGSMEFFFIENKEAKIHKTIVVKQKDVDKALLFIEKKLAIIPQNSYVRLKAAKDHPIFLRFDEIKKLYPFYNWSKTSSDEEENVFNDDLISTAIETTYNPISLNRDNIETLLMQRIHSSYSFDGSRINRIHSELIEAFQ